MIALIKGQIEYIQDNFAVILAGNIGFKVHMSQYTAGKIAGNEGVKLHTYTHVKEDILALYGFLSKEELKMFELLISINGVGPKAGMGILAIADPKSIKTAIVNQDSTILTKVSGIGKKTAERIILELGNKVDALPDVGVDEGPADHETVEALTIMGYSANEAREVIKQLPRDVATVEERVKMALKYLGKK